MKARLAIRWRLTLWYAAFLALALVLLGGIIFLVLRHQLYEGLDELLAQQAAVAETAISREGGVLRLAGPVALLDDDALVRLVLPNGSVVAQVGAPEGNFPLSDDTLAPALRGTTSTTVVETSDGSRWVRTLPVWSGNAIDGVLQVALSGDDVAETLDTLVMILAGRDAAHADSGRGRRISPRWPGVGTGDENHLPCQPD